MAGYSIGEVGSILGLKTHVLRYWEQEIDLLSPKKDSFGRRVYTRKDLQILLRVRHLIQERKYTVQGAAKKILEELAGEHSDTLAGLSLVRRSLFDAMDRSKKLKQELRNACAEHEILSGQKDVLPGIEDSFVARSRLREDLKRITPEYLETLAAILKKAPSHRDARPMRITSISRSGASERKAGEELIAGKHIAVVSPSQVVLHPCPKYAGCVPLVYDDGKKIPLLSYTAQNIRAAAYHCGSTPQWYILLPYRLATRVRSWIETEKYFRVRSSAVTLIQEEPIPFLTDKGDLIPLRDGSVAMGTSALYSALRVVTSERFLEESNRTGVTDILFVPPNNPSIRVYDTDFLGLHATTGSDISVKVMPAGSGNYLPTGSILFSLGFLSRLRHNLPCLKRKQKTAHVFTKELDTRNDEQNDENAYPEGYMPFVRVVDCIEAAERYCVVRTDRDEWFAGIREERDRDKATGFMQSRKKRWQSAASAATENDVIRSIVRQDDTTHLLPVYADNRYVFMRRALSKIMARPGTDPQQ
jgi:DNA-binding transcriptional MerR regulator